MAEQEKRKEELSLLAPRAYMNVQKEELPSSWKLSEQGIEAIKFGVAMNKTKHGMYASIPMLCKAEECQYADICPILDQGYNPKGERCPLEISLILTNFDSYKKEFETKDDDIVDMSFIKDLIDCDIQLMRAENKMALEGDFVQDNVVGMGEDGEPIVQKQISKASDYKERIMTKKHKILELMHSTRKDKAGSKLTMTMDPSSYAASLLKEKESAPGQVIDADYLESIMIEDEDE